MNKTSRIRLNLRRTTIKRLRDDELAGAAGAARRAGGTGGTGGILCTSGIVCTGVSGYLQGECTNDTETEFSIDCVFESGRC